MPGPGTAGVLPPPKRRPRPLRRRIASSTLGITGLALLLFALPLAVAVQQLYRGDEFARLQRDATRTVALVPDNPVSVASRLTIPGDLGDSSIIGIYTPAGERVGGNGPVRSGTAASARDGGVHQGQEGGQLAVAVPVPSDSTIVAVVRAAAPGATVARRVAGSWAAMALLASLVLTVAAALTRRQAGRIAEPLERLTTAARALGEGDFTTAAQHSGIQEADQASAALAATAARLGRLLERERAFSADASHQLRTPLTGLLLGLESALRRPGADLHAATRDAIARGEQLQRTIDDLLTLARDTSNAPQSSDLTAQLEAVVLTWSPVYAAAHRELSISIPSSLPPVHASPAALRQIFNVLLDNALRHGDGTVTLTAIDMDESVAVDVSDQGAGIPGNPEALFARHANPTERHGIGLPLARSLAEAGGGRLVVRRSGSNPVFTVLLPAAASVVATAGQAPAVTSPVQSGTPDPAGS